MGMCTSGLKKIVELANGELVAINVPGTPYKSPEFTFELSGNGEIKIGIKGEKSGPNTIMLYPKNAEVDLYDGYFVIGNHRYLPEIDHTTVGHTIVITKEDL
jgi:hypothetical protein